MIERSTMRRRALKKLSLIASAVVVLTACTPGTPDAGSATLKVAYQ